jgi:signal transduction histidine kinase
MASELHEQQRLAVLMDANLLDTPEEETFDRFTRLASAILKTPVALVSLVDRHRQFFKSSVGLPEPWATSRETPLSHSFCQHVVSTTEPLCVADARTHPLLRDNLAIADLGVIAYLGIPLTTYEGYTLGSFCAIDVTPREWSDRDVEILSDLAALVTEKIELRLFAKQIHTDYLQLRNLELFRAEMVQMLVHDLRNPLTAFISGLDTALLLGELTKTQQKCLSLAREGGTTLAQMIDSILDLSKSEIDQIELNLAAIAPEQMMQTACKQMTPLAEKSSVRLVCGASDLPPLMADIEKLRRVIVNLVGNAIQNTPPGGEIFVSAQEVERQTVRFAVTDTGRGIPAEAFDRIFQKFGRVPPDRGTGESNGHGLGLPFSRIVVEAHGGKIWVESELGHGTSFYFTLPLPSKLLDKS